MDRPIHAGLRHLALNARDLEAMKRFYIELLGEKGQISERETALIQEYTRAMTLYRTGSFEQALDAFHRSGEFERVTAEGAINPSRLFSDRCRTLIANPPAHWDGAWTLTSK